MISREFIYEFSNFDDIKSRENDKKSRTHDILTREMGVLHSFNVIYCCQVVLCRPVSLTLSPPLVAPHAFSATALLRLAMPSAFGVQLRVARAQGFHSLRSFHRLPVLCRPVGTIGYRGVEIWCR